eukprot:3811538-Rhodomonas_salina.3
MLAPVSVAIVGAGVAATALTKRLSCLDYNVTVFEQHAVQGSIPAAQQLYSLRKSDLDPLAAIRRTRWNGKVLWKNVWHWSSAVLPTQVSACA